MGRRPDKRLLVLGGGGWLISFLINSKTADRYRRGSRCDGGRAGEKETTIIPRSFFRRDRALHLVFELPVIPKIYIYPLYDGNENDTNGSDRLVVSVYAVVENKTRLDTADDVRSHASVNG